MRKFSDCGGTNRVALRARHDRGSTRLLDSTPPLSVTPHWHEREKDIVLRGFDAPGLADTFRLDDGDLEKTEKTLAAQPWLAGKNFSLADIAVTPYVNRLATMGITPMEEQKRLRFAGWFDRIKARAAFKPAFLDWCPPDLKADLLTFGRQSWPSVERMVAGVG